MSLFSPEQIAATQKNNLDISLGLLNTAFEGFRKLVELNLQAFKSTLVESQDAVREALSFKDPQELAALHVRLLQPATDKIQSYNRQVFAIVAATQTEVAKVAEMQYETHNREVQTLVESLGRSAPVGSEAAVVALRSITTAANTLYETLQRTTQQAVDVAESNFHAVTGTASKAAQRGIEQTSRVAQK
ncbi:Phasin protein (plasmid) [Caballeronia sp. SBC1]|uniref:TIGR01841 family phasin n=1 Tax=unclassified Caballeronia TaxID=2646786 RepID=UPI0013E0FAD9|nr:MULTISPECIES: TIGR01841 family phasin [unclassified Caballeronia]QIE25821.1 Phasin protein [Caballeronia sp. SBC2]QIN64866.1 Phasin protein [Caballeronia sp. SBC1]